MAASMRTCLFRGHLLRNLPKQNCRSHSFLSNNVLKPTKGNHYALLYRVGSRQRDHRAFSLSLIHPNSENIKDNTAASGAGSTSQDYIHVEPTVEDVTDKEDEASDQSDNAEDYHTIIKDTERSKGPSDKHEFQAETRQLLDIVARSLYSEKEVFIRELISNASDALEKLRLEQMTGVEISDPGSPLEIHIAVDESKKTFTIQDTGIGMSKEEMIENLGTIAKSGSKAFLENIAKQQGDVGSKIIGQFGVGFYSSFMVADKVEVFSQAAKPGSKPFKWSSDGTGTYEIAEAENVQRGTKIVLHLKGDCYDYAKEDIIKEVVKKYSNFVGVPIFLNGKKANIVQALWLMDPKDITEEMHEEFYRYIGNVFDKPRYHMQYKIDVPLNIRALFYVPEYKPTMFDLSRETDVSITLYSRKVMVLQKANTILPKWLRFLKGVIDSEDIPLNLSRELLQDSALIRKLRNVLSTRIIKFFLQQAKKDNSKYMKFYEDYGLFFREGIVTTHDQQEREEIARLLRFESSKCAPGEKVSLEEYTERMKAGTRNIFYLSAPSRELAERSPYLEALEKKDIEVLFLFEPYDELVLMNMGQFDKKFLKSIENEVRESADLDYVDSADDTSLSQEDANTLMDWLNAMLQSKVHKVKVTRRLSSHPCVITVQEMASARHFLRTTLADKSPEERYRVLQPTLEINPNHPLIHKLNKLKDTNVELAKLVADQLYDNAMVNAGLMEDPRTMMGRMNELLERALEKH